MLVLAVPGVGKIHRMLKNTIDGWLLSLDFSGREASLTKKLTVCWTGKQPHPARIQVHLRRSGVGGESLSRQWRKINF